MALLRRGHDRDAAAAAATAQAEADDSPAALSATLQTLVRFINASAGELPVGAVVAALDVTDTIRAVIDTAEDAPLDTRAVVSIKGVIDDYLPTTLRRYLSLDPSLTDTPRPSGRTPKDSLVEQLGSLGQAASEVLAAARAQDADALLTQGTFLRTKFTRSDLDL